jgi:hypothetical protein
MVTHYLLVAAAVLFILWIIGLAGGWAVHTAWTLFIVACVLVVVWMITGGLSRRGSVP